jgi:hypothetical protein
MSTGADRERSRMMALRIVQERYYAAIGPIPHYPKSRRLKAKRVCDPLNKRARVSDRVIFLKLNRRERGKVFVRRMAAARVSHDVDAMFATATAA